MSKKKIITSGIILIFTLALGLIITKTSNLQIAANQTTANDEQSNIVISDTDDNEISTSSNMITYSERFSQGVIPFVPFGNGRGVQIINDHIFTFHSESGSLYLIDHYLDDDGNIVQDITDPSGGTTGASVNSLAEDNGNLLAVWTEKKGLVASMSLDGISWEEPVIVGNPKRGASVPSSCMWQNNGQTNAIVAWVDPSTEKDVGSIYISNFVEGSWSSPERVGSLELASSPSLYCDENRQMMVMRSGEKNALSVYFSNLKNGQWEDPRNIFKGADPHMAVCGDDIWIGYHTVGAYLAHSDDGGESWNRTLLDENGKFGSIACEDEKIIVEWGTYTSIKAANDGAKDSSERTVGTQISLDGGDTWEVWEPANGEYGQSVASVDIENGEIVVFWRADDRIRVRRYLTQD